MLRDEHGRAEQNHAKDQLEKDRSAEVAVLQQLQINDGIVVVPLPQDKGDKQHRSDDSGSGDNGRTEPVLFLPLVEEELEHADAAGDKSEAAEVDLLADGGLAALNQRRWVFHHARAEPDRKKTDGYVDEKNPVPVEVVRNPAAERGTDRGSDHHGHAINGKRLPALFNGERVGENSLLRGRKTAAAQPLQHAGEDQERKRRGKAERRWDAPK